MIELFLLNFVVIIPAYLILGLPARRLRRKLDDAGRRLADTTVDREVRLKFDAVRIASANDSQRVFWLGLLSVLAILTFGFQAYATSVEPEAELWTWLVINLLVFGIALLGVAVILSILVSNYWQSRQVATLIDNHTNSYPNSSILREVRDAITPKVGELGVSLVASLTVVGCLLYGLVLIAIFYMAAQTAIECARSSKCM